MTQLSHHIFLLDMLLKSRDLNLLALSLLEGYIYSLNVLAIACICYAITVQGMGNFHSIITLHVGR
jgi:hypothetical protein